MTKLEIFEIPTTQEFFSTKEVQEISGFTKEALRYYEKLGIFGKIARNPTNNYRLFTQDNLQRLLFVRVFQYLGMDLNYLVKLSQDYSDEKYIELLLNYQQTVQEHVRQLTEMDKFIDHKVEIIKNHKK